MSDFEMYKALGTACVPGSIAAVKKAIIAEKQVIVVHNSVLCSFAFQAHYTIHIFIEGIVLVLKD